MSESLLERFRRGDRLALARLLTALSRGRPVEETLAGLPPPTKPARVVAITGSGGVGKSTLIGKLIELLRGRGLTVAVLACDPQSPLSGGALLGDRFRMAGRPDDDGVFIRSLAAPGDHGAIARHLDGMIHLLEIFGFDVILVETAGAGQGDTAVHRLADVLVLLLQPETGDELQWEKAGLLEVAEVVVVHKADLPGAAEVAAQVRSSLELPGGRPVRLIQASARTGQGLEQLWQLIDSCPLRRGGREDEEDGLLRLAQEVLSERYAGARANQDPELLAIIERWQRGDLEPSAAGAALLGHLGRREGV